MQLHLWCNIAVTLPQAGCTTDANGAWWYVSLSAFLLQIGVESRPGTSLGGPLHWQDQGPPTDSSDTFQGLGSHIQMSVARSVLYGFPCAYKARLSPFLLHMGAEAGLATYWVGTPELSVGAQKRHCRIGKGAKGLSI